MRLLVAALIVLGLALPVAAAARLASRSWAKGAIVEVNAAGIVVRGSVVVTLANGSGGTTKFTLSGIRRLSCSVDRTSVVHGYRIGNDVSIVCDGGVLSHIAHVG